ncbi:exodeoxyribonuclease V subunit gamma [Balneola sp. MJW-20]|uniref:exodeoxyribonuclease V subunit gamma n=1 Tax=Gracilimonas aurantiaca TaxID=3234185 RepID=UPI003466E341
MLNIFSASDLDVLFDQFISDIKYPEDPMEPVWIIIQNKETQEWLNLRVSEVHGIAANIKYILPSELLWNLYRAKDQSLKSELPSDKNSMVWAIHQILQNNKGLIPFIDRSDAPESKLLDISIQVADVFDLYQNYRPEMLEDWLQGKSVPDLHAWQVEIWKKLQVIWEHEDQWKIIPRRSEAFIELINWSRKGILDNNLPSDIYVFGISHTSKPQMDLFAELAGRINLNLYAFEVLSDSVGVHSLISKWTKVKKDQLDYLYERAKSIKSEISIKKTQEKIELPGNIHIHSCHSPERETEVLKNDILRCLEDDRSLDLEDILILVPDPEIYAPLIKGIFTDAERGKHLSVSDMTLSGQPEPSDSIELLLKLLKSDFKSGWISELFMDPLLKKRFGLTEDEVFRLEKWISDNNVFHGLGHSFNTPYSWKKGLSQMMLGFIMEPADLTIYKGMVPYQGAGSIADSDSLSGFSEMLRLIEKHKKFSEKSREIRTWLNWISDLSQDFLNTGDDHSDHPGKLNQLIRKLLSQAKYHNDPVEITFRQFSRWFSDQLPGIKARSGRFGQGITVSTYIPYRAVPFKVIAIMGMNEGTFPRKDIRPEFDIINSQPELGDRIQKEDDCLWFAETISAAGESLIITFIGKDQQNDREMLPSILIQQLMDKLAEDNEFQFIEHPLHPFSSKYFNGMLDPSYDHYSAQILQEINAEDVIPVFIDRDELPRIEIEEEIHFSELVSFFVNPARYYLKKTVGIDFRDDQFHLKERENFEIKGLNKYLLDQAIFKFKNKGFEESEVLRYLEASNLITGDQFNMNQVNDEIRIIDSLLEAVNFQQNEVEREILLDLDISGIKIVGEIGGVFGDQYVSFRVGKDKASVLVDHWLKYLLVSVADPSVRSATFWYKESSSSAIKNIEHISEKPIESLERLVSWFKLLNSISDLNFFPESSKSYTKAVMSGKSEEKATEDAQLQYSGNSHVRGEQVDYHFRLLWKGRDPLTEAAFKDNAMKFWEPYFNSIR